MKTGTASAILSNGQLNINFIQKEVTKEISDDAMYRAEDKMKKKVVHTSKNYEEFRQSVACSQLQTLPSSKFHELFSQNSTSSYSFNQPKKQLNSKRKNGRHVNIDKKNLPYPSSSTMKENNVSTREEFLLSKPFNAMDFQKHWHRYCPTIEDKVNYLIRTTVNDDIKKNESEKQPSANETKIDHRTKQQFLFSPIDAITLFKLEIDCSTMVYIIESLDYLLLQYKNNSDSSNDMCQEEEKGNVETHLIFDSRSILSFIYDWLAILPKCGRFSINVLFLQEKHKNILSFLFNEMDCNDSDHQVFDNSNSSMITEGVWLADAIKVLRKEFGLP